MRPEKIAVRPGRDPGDAGRCITEIKSPLRLQPGPAALTDGLDAIVAAPAWTQKVLPIATLAVRPGLLSPLGCTR